MLRSKIIVGTPAMVADRLAQLQEELGLDGILAEMNCGMRIPNRLVTNSLQTDVRAGDPAFPPLTARAGKLADQKLGGVANGVS